MYRNIQAFLFLCISAERDICAALNATNDPGTKRYWKETDYKIRRSQYAFFKRGAYCDFLLSFICFDYLHYNRFVIKLSYQKHNLRKKRSDKNEIKYARNQLKP